MANQNPIVTITMENGDVMKAELYPEIAPNTVNNFISLINKGFYDGVVFHRIIPGFMIQGGDPEGTGMGGPGYSIKGEFSHNGFKNDLLHTMVFFLWHVQWFLTQQVHSSLSCMQMHLILMVIMQHSANSQRAKTFLIKSQHAIQTGMTVHYSHRL